MEEAGKYETFLEETIYAILVGEYVRVQKFMKSFASRLQIWRDIGNAVCLYGDYGALNIQRSKKKMQLVLGRGDLLIDTGT